MVSSSPPRRAAPRRVLTYALCWNFLFLGFLVFTANSGAPALTWQQATGSTRNDDSAFSEKCGIWSRVPTSGYEGEGSRGSNSVRLKSHNYWRLDVCCVSVTRWGYFSSAIRLPFRSLRFATNLPLCSSCGISYSLAQPQGQRCRFQHEFYCSFMKGGKGCCDLPWSFDALLSVAWNVAGNVPFWNQFTRRLSSSVDIVHLHLCNVTFQFNVSVKWQ